MIDPRKYRHIEGPIYSVGYQDGHHFGQYDLLVNDCVFMTGVDLDTAMSFMSQPFPPKPTMPILNFTHDRDYSSSSSVRYADDKNGYQIRFWCADHDYAVYDCKGCIPKEGNWIKGLGRYATFSEAVAACQKHFDENHRPKIKWKPCRTHQMADVADVEWHSSNYDCQINFWAHNISFTVYDENGSYIVDGISSDFPSFAEAEAHAQKYAKVK